jgi:hypothetical protein
MNPRFFGCPDQKTLKRGTRRWRTSTTNYLALVGPRAAFKPGSARKHADFVDNTHYTIMVVEVTNSDVNWLEPRDIKTENGSFPIASGPHEEETGVGPKSVGFYATNVDGSVRFLPSNTASDTLKALVTIDGDEAIPDEF